MNYSTTAAGTVLALRAICIAALLLNCWLLSAATIPTENYRLTNGPCVFRISLQTRTNVVPFPRTYQPPPTNWPFEIRRAVLYYPIGQQITFQTEIITNSSFDHFLPDSLSYLIWTNVIAHTNGKSMTVWSKRSRPPGWPEQPPQVEWNPHSLLWGMRGFTALSPSWEGEGNPGQVPITALTRRHGYTRGHDMGPAGFHTRLEGKRVWFLTAANQVVERKITREVVRTVFTDQRDYTIVLFDKDLPPGIEPMRVVSTNDFSISEPTRLRFCIGAPMPLFKTEQTGAVSADIPAFTVNTWKGGDSGSPNMLPLPGELAFLGGRSTSAASAAMQADMDELCRQQHLEPRRYQLRWVELSRFPIY